MSFESLPRPESETPIERIFLKVMGRKMTPEERMCFHLKNGRPHAYPNSKNGAGPNHKSGSKLTRR